MFETSVKRILFYQFLFLVTILTTSALFFKYDFPLFEVVLFCGLAIALNLLFIKFVALPNWREFEEALNQKNMAFNKERKEFEQVHLKYQQILDALNDPVCILGRSLNVIYANMAFINMFELGLKTLPLPLIEVTRHLDFFEFLKMAVKKQKKVEQASFSFDPIQGVHKNYYDISVFPISDMNNFLCVLHDVTEKKRIDQMREDFVSNFSHEVRTPLTIVNGQIQGLKSELIKAPDFDTHYGLFFEKIEKNSRRLINLFNDLLQLTSVESKKEIKKEPVNIAELIEILSAEVQSGYPDKKIAFTFDFKRTLFSVDYNLFEQALLNLIDNAIKYSHTEGMISISSFRENDWDYLIIKDNGIGIPEENIQRIFERFFRVDSGRSSQISGTGLGLSIVKHIIQKHDGKIKVQSRPGAGTSFTLVLPALAD